MSFDVSLENRELRNPAHLAEYLAAEPVPEACENCWQRWERKLNVGQAPGQMPLDVALRLYHAPEFNPTCAMCVAGFEAAVEQLLALAERYGSLV